MPIGNTTLPNLSTRNRTISISSAGLIVSGSVIISGSANTITLSGASTTESPATQTYVTGQINNLVDSAPTALDTLNELAAAIGDDANYASTVSTALGNRLRVDTASQGLNSTQQSNARTNLGLGTAATSAASAFQSALTNPVTGTGTTNYIPKLSGTSAITNSVIFESGSNIGIGTTSPTSKLHVVAPGALSTDIGLKVRNSANTGDILNAKGNGNVQVGVGGLSIPRSDYPDGSLLSTITYQTNGMTRISTGIEVPNGIYGSTTTSTSILALSLGYYSIDLRNYGGGSSAGFTFSNSVATTGTYYMRMQNGGTDVFNISSTGNVGIGKTTASTRLDVSGSAIITGSLTTTAGITSAVDMRAPIVYDSNNTSYYVDAASTSNLVGLTVANTITGRISGFAGAGSPKLYSTDSSYNYDAANPYYAYITYNGTANRWRFKVSPATPEEIEVAYADAAGTATSAATWTTGRTLTIGSTGKSVNGSGNVTWSLSEIGALPTAGGTMSGNIAMGGYSITGADGYTGTNFIAGNAFYLNGTSTFLNYTNGRVYSNSGFESAVNVVAPILYDADNTGYYVDPASTSNFAGLTVANTITGNISGNAGTATSAATLTTARSINGTNFNGSAGITTANWGTGRTITIGSTGKSVNGSADVSWTLSEIGAYAASNPSGYIAPSYLDDYTRGAYQVISDYNSASTWYIRSNGQFIWGLAHDYSKSFTLNLPSGNNDNSTWATLGQRNSNVTNGTWKGLSIQKYASGAITLGDLQASSVFAKNLTDVDDTNYYVDPASTTYSSYNAGGARFRNIIISNSTYTDTIQNATSGGNIWINYGHNGNVGLAYGGGYTTAYQSMRSPIFYDSDDTNYYVDPASTGTSLNVRGVIQNPSIWINDGDNYNNYNENIRLFNASNGVSVIAFGASGTGGIPQSSLLGFSDRLEIRVGANGTAVQRNYDNYVEAIGSFRAPLFYDSNDTNYYADPAGTSAFNATVAQETYVNGWFRNNSSNNGLYNQATTQHWSSNTNGYWDASSTTGVTGIRLYASGHVNSLRGYLYANGDGIGLLNNLGSWSVKCYYGSGYGGELNASWTATGDLRAPYFYDSSNTNYFLLPSGQSVVNSINGVQLIASQMVAADIMYDYSDSSYYVDPASQSVLSVVSARAAAIGTTSTPDPCAVLEVQSTTQGFLPPRMSDYEMNNISGPVPGLIVWNTDSQVLQVFDGSSWRKLAYS